MRLGVAAALVDGNLVPGDVTIRDGIIDGVGIGLPKGNRLAIPGFVDLQVNGFAGVDFLNADLDGYRRAGAALLKGGVTAYQPTFITASETKLLSALTGMPTDAAYPQIIGAHLEGPFISAERLGAHPGEYRRDPDLQMLIRLLQSTRVTQMTLAPELPGAEALIKQLVEAGLVASAGHSNADAGAAHRGFDLGISTVTHLFNAMPPMLSRDPGIVGAALARDDVWIQMIVDGHHLSDETVRSAWAAARGRIALVTDATAAAAAAGSSHQLGDSTIDLDSGSPRNADGVLAGTALTMLDAVRNVHGLGIPLAEALTAATAAPAHILRRKDIGVLEPGHAADVVLLDDRLEIISVMCAEASLSLR